MAWTKTLWTYAPLDEADPDKIRVDWRWEDTVDSGIKKRGTFEFTIIGADTWTVNKAAIQTKVDNGDGAEA